MTSSTQNVSQQHHALANQVIVITGATGAIGSQLAILAVKAGAEVILIGRKMPKLTLLYDQLVTLGEKEPAILAMDFATCSADDFLRLAETLHQHYGRVDGIVHAAAQLANLTPLAHVSPDKWQLCQKVSLETPFLMTQALLPLLYEAKDKANVVFLLHEMIASGQKAYWGSYAVAKAGLKTLMHLWAEEHENQGKVYFNGFDPICVNSALRFSIAPAGDKTAYAAIDVARQLMQVLINSKQVTGQIYSSHFDLPLC